MTDVRIEIGDWQASCRNRLTMAGEGNGIDGT